jgi:hypothetical protein
VISEVVRVSIEVRNGAVRFGVAVRAESIRRVLSIVRKRCPGSEVEWQFPIDPEGFFVRDRAAVGGPIETGKLQKLAP